MFYIKKLTKNQKDKNVPLYYYYNALINVSYQVVEVMTHLHTASYF